MTTVIQALLTDVVWTYLEILTGQGVWWRFTAGSVFSV